MLGLPQVPSPLKAITPFLQRAEEVKVQDPVIAYWSAYYAAQIGISLKSKDEKSRNILVGLLGVLEQMKKDIGANDAIDVEAASGAYVENFALKVFAVADNEDRRGEATRATAKKFLAAANFLEVLKIFPKSEFLESNEEKVRYAKWKAADIAKALREGRKPVPGPAASEEDSADVVLAAADVLSVEDRANLTPPPLHQSTLPSPERMSHSDSSLQVPPPLASFPDQSEPQTPPQSARSGWDSAQTPSSWSTMATPGTAHRRSEVQDWDHQESWVEPVTPSRTSNHDLDFDDVMPETSIYSAKHATGSGTAFPSEDAANYSPTHVHVDAMPKPVSPQHYAERVLAHVSPPPAPPQPALADVQVDLTPAVVAKAQKHARFAISALDYEDLEQAKKDLRTALAILGGR